MTPDQIQARGDELIEKFGATYIIHPNGIVSTVSNNPVKCAIIAVEEIINLCAYGLSETEYWNEVLNYLKSKL